MRGVWRLRRLVDRLTPKAIILLYHRIAQVDSDPQLLCVTPQHFAEHLAILHRTYHPLSLRSLTRRFSLNLIPPRSVVVTFDDGYADNLNQAKPLLAQYDIAATVFVATGQIGQSREFWWDDLARLLLNTSVLPERLMLRIGNTPYVWNLADAHGKSVASHISAWHVLMDDANPRHIAYRQLMTLLRGLDAAERKNLMAELTLWAGMSGTGRPENLSLSEAELHTLAEGELIEIGVHTMNHPVLSSLSDVVQQIEIVEGKRQLEQILGRPVVCFSYPYGGRQHYNAKTVQMVRQAGFACACSNFPGLVQYGTDRYQLPRYLVRDWNGNEFSQRLAKWFNE